VPFQWGFCFAPSPLRGEGRDEEWFKITLNLANLTPALSLERRGRKANSVGKEVASTQLAKYRQQNREQERGDKRRQDAAYYQRQRAEGAFLEIDFCAAGGA